VYRSVLNRDTTLKINQIGILINLVEVTKYKAKRNPSSIKILLEYRGINIKEK
jgi:hypothetical protein